MTEDKYPPISPGASVRTTQANESLRKEWSEGVWEKRQWGVQGSVVTHHDSHGLCYDVQHEDGTIGSYEHDELREYDRRLLEAVPCE